MADRICLRPSPSLYPLILYLSYKIYNKLFSSIFPLEYQKALNYLQ